jgi:uncharacterized membrane protein YbaN (DUF454 family)
MKAGLRRRLYLTLGVCSAAMGAAGVVLPLVPTTPFLLVSVWAFSRSSPRLQRWLETHPRFGPPLAAWRKRRAIPRRAKALAAVALAASWSVTAVAIGGMLAPLVSGVALSGVALWILTRPTDRISAP